MSQKATRKSQNTTAPEEKDKFETPVKEMKKKLAANAEKDKQAAEKVEKTAEKNDKSETADKNKSNDKTEKPDKSDKQEKVADKKTEKVDKSAEKSSDKKAAEKTSDKSAEKKVEKPADKNVEKVDKSAEKKVDKPAEKKTEQPDKNETAADKPKEAPAVALNGNSQTRSDANGTASDGSSDELVIEDDENFPELAYDDSETEAEPDAPSRSLTRRSQVKVTKTPETPRPASDKDGDDSRELEKKLLKLKDEVVPPSDRKLRSADSPKPDAKKLEKKQDLEEKKQEEKKATSKKDLEGEMEVDQVVDAKPEEKASKSEVDVVIEIDSAEGSAKRARVSPYSRTRHDRTRTSVMAEYSGNNSTMETSLDASEASWLEQPDDSGYLRAVRGMRGRASYKQLKELTLTHPHANRPRPQPQVSLGRPTGAVVGRKRKPSSDAAPHSPAADVAEEAAEDLLAHGKRMRLLDRLSMSFRRTRHTAEIVGINTDLPLTAPVASSPLASFDPESIKAAPAQPAAPDRNNARCLIM